MCYVGVGAERENRVVQSSKPQQQGDWYKISLDTVRGWVIFAWVVVLAVVGLIGIGYLRDLSHQRQAAIVIDETQLLLTRAQSGGGAETHWEDYDQAWKILQRARTQLADGDHSEALANATWSRNVLVSMLDVKRQEGPRGDAQFVAVDGGVEYRRREGAWQVARNRVVLRSGDYVKTTGDGSAQIRFSDGTLFKVRPSTVILINRSASPSGKGAGRSISLEYGWVNLNTASSPSRVSTPGAEATVAESSEAIVSYDESGSTARFAVYEGEAEVADRSGDSRHLGALQQTMHSGSVLSSVGRLLGSPSTVAPADGVRVDIATSELVLRWRRVPGAARYALQVSRDEYFVDNVIDVEDRTRTFATIGLRGEGDFRWRVAAYGRDGLKGPWSEPLGFTVNSNQGGSQGRDSVRGAS